MPCAVPADDCCLLPLFRKVWSFQIAVGSRRPQCHSQFLPMQPRDWTGRYGAIPGKISRFHVRHRDHRHGLWPYALMREDEDKGTCWAVECTAAGDLARAVHRAKQWMGGPGCGSFLV